MVDDIRARVSTCEACRTYEISPPKETLMSSEVPERPWQRVASDLFVYKNVDYLVTVDYYSDFYELDRLSNTRAETVVKATQKHFSTHGIPEQFISDNGPQYVSGEFAQFANRWDFEHVTTSPYNSKANGKAEATVKKAKNLLRKAEHSNENFHLALLEQRNVPSETTGSSPVQRLMNRRTRTTLPMSASLLQPRSIDTCKERMKMKQRQLKQAHYYNRTAHDLPVLEEGDTVRMKPHILGQKQWQKGEVLKRLDERSYEVETPSGVYRRNRMHLRRTEEPTSTPDLVKPPPDVCVSPKPASALPKHVSRTPKDTPVNSPVKVAKPDVVTETVMKEATPTNIPRPKRLVKKPSYLGDYVSK